MGAPPTQGILLKQKGTSLCRSLQAQEKKRAQDACPPPGPHLSPPTESGVAGPCFGWNLRLAGRTSQLPLLLPQHCPETAPPRKLLCHFPGGEPRCRRRDPGARGGQGLPAPQLSSWAQPLVGRGVTRWDTEPENRSAWPGAARSLGAAYKIADMRRAQGGPRPHPTPTGPSESFPPRGLLRALQPGGVSSPPGGTTFALKSVQRVTL